MPAGTPRIPAGRSPTAPDEFQHIDFVQKKIRQRRVRLALESTVTRGSGEAADVPISILESTWKIPGWPRTRGRGCRRAQTGYFQNEVFISVSVTARPPTSVGKTPMRTLQSRPDANRSFAVGAQVESFCHDAGNGKARPP